MYMHINKFMVFPLMSRMNPYNLWIYICEQLGYLLQEQTGWKVQVEIVE